MNDQTKIAIDGTEYLTADLPNEAKEQLANITLVDRKIAETQQEIAILQTARNAYAAALTAALPKN
jgi:cell division protein ZapA (FtsZ GTPase activity inhibitor)